VFLSLIALKIKDISSQREHHVLTSQHYKCHRVDCAATVHSNERDKGDYEAEEETSFEEVGERGQLLLYRLRERDAGVGQQPNE